jgi:hypothetical protein
MTIKNKIGKYVQTGRQWYTRGTSGIKYITVHHTADLTTGTQDQILARLHSYHVNNGWPGLSYHYIILRDGSVHQIHPHTNVTWHDGHNWDSLAVCLHGYYHEPHNQKPTDSQMESYGKLMRSLVSQYPNAKVVGHRDRGSTACPGSTFYPLLNLYKQEGFQSFLNVDIPTEVEDGYGLKNIKRYNKYWTYEELILDWVKLTDEVGYLRAEIELREEKSKELGKAFEMEIDFLQGNLKALEGDLKSEEQKYKDLMKRYDTLQEKLAEERGNCQLLEKEISRLTEMLEDTPVDKDLVEKYLTEQKKYLSLVSKTFDEWVLQRGWQEKLEFALEIIFSIFKGGGKK